MIEERKQRELDFHNRRFHSGTRSGSLNETTENADRFYSVAKKSRTFYANAIKQDCEKKQVLEYGCGTGSFAFALADKGANVTGIDISDVAVNEATKTADSRQGGRPQFLVMDAESLEFDDNRFDLICGGAILHHLDIDRAFAEISRTLKPTGKAIFIEPLGHNPLINVYRRLTPNIRTPDEHPLFMQDLATAKQYFQSIDVNYFHLFSLASVPFRKFRWFRTALNVLDNTDAFLFWVIPFMRRFAWTCVIEFSQPVKNCSVE